jgi:peptidoglycan/LPS O-acetylase OafA/YrhL
MTETRARKLNTLTSLRFIAAALIVVHHSRGSFGFPIDLWEPFSLDNGVSFFFVLSGFILTYVYPSLSSLGRKRFLWARIARIWPAHVTAFLLLVILWPEVYATPERLRDPRSLGTALANLSLVHAWIPMSAFFFSFNGPSWSISTELGFYLCFMLLIPNWQRTWFPKLVLAFLMLCGVVTMSRVLHLPAGSGVAEWHPSELGLVYVNPIARLFEFTLGMTTALIWHRLAPKVTIGWPAATLVELVAFGLVLLSLYYGKSWAAWAAQNPWVGSAGLAWLIHGGASCVSLAVLIFVMALERGAISGLLSLPAPVLLGEISYSVYLLHQMLIVYYNSHARAFQWVPQQVAYLVFLMTLLLAAYLSWAVVERPCRRFLVSLWPGAASVAPVADWGGRGRAQEGAPGANFGMLLAPTWRHALVAAILLLGLTLPIAYAVNLRPSINLVDPAYAEGLASRGLREARDVNFGNQFILLGADVGRTEDGLSIELVWQSAGPQRLEYLVAVHVVNGAGTILSQADYPQDVARTEVPAGAVWRDVVVISSERLRDASAVAIGVFRQEPLTVLRADRGPRDWDGHRLLLPIPGLTAASPVVSGIAVPR